MLERPGAMTSEPGSDRLRERLPEPTLEHLPNTTRDLIAELAAKLDFVINAVVSPHFRVFVVDVMELGVELNKVAPGANFCDIFPSWSHATMSERFLKRGYDVFGKCFRIIRQEHRFINLLCDARTVKSIKIVHRAISNPTRLCEILPLEPPENDGRTAADYESFFTETTTDLYQRGTPYIENCGIMCDLLPAQISGLSSFLSVEGGPGSGIMDVPWLNHIANLVSSYAIQCDPLVEATNYLPDRIHKLCSKQSVEILGNNGPGPVRTRWVYMVEVLKFLLTCLTAAQTLF
jgi:hypothetical protein